MENISITRTTIHKVSGGHVEEKQDFLASEEPMEIRLEFGPPATRQVKSLSVTMRTPGADEDLVAGFLFTEGIVQNPSDLISVRVLDAIAGSEQAGNILLADLNPDLVFDIKQLDRHFYTTSSCGVCGKTSIDAVKSSGACKVSTENSWRVQPEVIHGLPNTLRQVQETFDATGGLHAAALFDRTGNLLALREDVGRHNALDKLIGHFFKKGTIPLEEAILLLSGRASFELLQKAAMAGIRLVCAVGAPSSLAVETANAFGISLIGFLRDNRFNLYSKPELIAFDQH